MSAYPKFPAAAPEAIKERYEKLAPILFDMGTLRSVDADALVRYLLLEWEYGATTKRVVAAIQKGEISDVERWTSVQDRLHKQINTLADRFGLTPSARRERGLLLPEE